MVDAIGMYSGIRPSKGAGEPTFFALVPSGGATYEHKNNPVRDVASGLRERMEKHADQFTPILQTKSLHGVLNSKGEPEARRSEVAGKSLTAGIMPSTGYARHQAKGLATDKDKPMRRPLMPIAGFYDQDQVNTLGQVKG